jgi:hypothetical protein
MFTISSIRSGARAIACASLLVCTVSTLLGMRAAGAASQPHLAIVTEHWKSQSGRCSADLEHATVLGVPQDVKARIDASLANLLATQSPTAPLTRAKREANCAQVAADVASYVKKIEQPYTSFEEAKWTTGLARGRWLSVRLHVTAFAIENAHPSDQYAAVTFDLDHGGYPVPRNGFYTNAQRAALDAKLVQSEMAAIRHDDPSGLSDADAMASIRQQIAQAETDESHFLLTSSGIEFMGAIDAEPFNNEILKLSYAELKGIGTPGGPLDPATRTQSLAKSTAATSALIPAPPQVAKLLADEPDFMPCSDRAFVATVLKNGGGKLLVTPVTLESGPQLLVADAMHSLGCSCVNCEHIVFRVSDGNYTPVLTTYGYDVSVRTDGTVVAIAHDSASVSTHTTYRWNGQRYTEVR